MGYGVIDWKPNLIATKSDNPEFKLLKPEVNYQMIIEGFTKDGKLISDRLEFKSPPTEQSKNGD